ncbi:MAG TPA: pantetheine-phosphate adenylyltransferase [Planctomycetota bacterium]|jgi:pantetheine-phosphate adenylyltransferase|nr:pantetheine-phosphate adenylyltransferase [Planctomycetota bacterium]
MNACYAGSFDPLTFGHLDILSRALKIFERVTLAIGRNEGKTPLFSLEERLDLLRRETHDLGDRVVVAAFDGLVVDYCAKEGIKTLIRGVRTVVDFEAEMAMAYANRRLMAGIDTVVFYPSEATSYISSRLIKEVARGGGDISGFVPPLVAEALIARIGRPGRGGAPQR